MTRKGKKKQRKVTETRSKPGQGALRSESDPKPKFASYLEKIHGGWIAAIATGAYLFWSRRPLLGEIILDDSFITYRFAKNLVEHGQFVFNPGEQVLATSTPLFALLLTPFYLLKLDLFYAAPIINMVLEGLIAYFAFIVIKRIFPHYPILILVIFIVFFFSDSRELRSSTAGMETSLYVLLILVIVWLALKESWLWVGITGGLLFLTRPDGVVIVAVVFLYHFLLKRKLPLRSAIGFAAMVSPWLIFATLYYGNPIPSGVWAKLIIIQGFGDPLMQKLELIYFPEGNYWFLAGCLLGGAGIALAGHCSFKKNRRFLAIFPTFFVLYNLGMVLPHNSYNWYWYWVPLMLVVYMHAGYIVAEIVYRYKYALAIPILGLPALLFYLLAVNLPAETKWIKVRNINWDVGVKVLSYWIAQNSQPDSTVMCITVGLPGYYSNRRLIDPLGIATPALLKNWSKEQYNLDALRRTRPDYYISYEPMDERYREMADEYILTARIPMPMRLISRQTTYLYRKKGLPGPKEKILNFFP
jgi:hypothetical protein